MQQEAKEKLHKGLPVVKVSIPSMHKSYDSTIRQQFSVNKKLAEELPPEQKVLDCTGRFEGALSARRAPSTKFQKCVLALSKKSLKAYKQESRLSNLINSHNLSHTSSFYNG